MTAPKKEFFAASGLGTLYCPVELMLDGELTFQEIKVLLALFSHANQVTGTCNPSLVTLSELTGIKTTNLSCKKAGPLRSLEKKGWLAIIPGNAHTCNAYALRIPQDPTGDRFRCATNKQLPAEQYAKKVAEKNRKIAADMSKAQARWQERHGVANVYRTSDGTLHDTLESAEAAEAAIAANALEQPKSGGITDPYANEADEFLAMAQDEPSEFEGMTRRELVDMQYAGVQLPRYIIEKFNLDPSL